ncbi:AAA family ATPase [Flavobacterium sp. IB48]|uniref:AAA family ATPase n=1 Tax=Flavobacterium sp. IB48 TaxID=2779375 RepID=UPI0018E82DF9|nr:AAA family ATPase [Flavobacterium sp. IB48]MBJ2124320.1 ATP-binding protein [Flavobacterium sp. IB48]
MIHYSKIPPKLLLPKYKNQDISILIGENGSGKSSLLNDISYFYLSQNMQVIAIANSIYDKFSSRNKKQKALRASSGKNLAQKTLINTLKELNQDDSKRLRNIGITLDYIGYDPIVGFGIKGLDLEFREKIIASNLAPDLKEIFLFFLNRFIDENFHNSKIVPVNFYVNNFDDLTNSFLIQIFSFEKELKSLKLIKGIDVYLSKKGTLIPLAGASSGELSLITTLLFITATIDDTTVILIDEPENSLHPKWQIEYIRRLDELFYFFEPKIVVATHSPLIINGAELHAKDINIFKGINGEFILNKDEKVNVEEIYQEYFDITAPQNRYLSEYLVEKLNLLALKKIGIGQFRKEVLELIESSYDNEQKKALRQVLEMSDQILKEIS